MAYYMYRVLMTLCALLPWAVSYWLASRLSEAYYLLDGNGRRSIQTNLRVALGPGAPQATIRRLSLAAYRSFGMYLIEFFSFHRMKPEFITEHTTVVGREHLEAALKQGKGCLVVSGHYSNWELGTVVVANMGFPIVAITQKHPDLKVNDVFDGQRAAGGVTVKHSEHGALACLRALRDNKPIAIMGDRTMGGSAVPTRFFGRWTVLPQGPWRLSADTGAPILPTFMVRTGRGRYVLEIGAPLPAPEGGSRTERMSELSQAYAARFEARILMDPGQWAAFYPMWEIGRPRRTPAAPESSVDLVSVSAAPSRLEPALSSKGRA